VAGFLVFLVQINKVRGFYFDKGSVVLEKRTPHKILERIRYRREIVEEIIEEGSENSIV